jgi:hypothetical protein
MTTRTTEPTRITTGDTVEWTRTFPAYPADEWTLQYRFRGPGEGFNIDAEQNADDARKFDVTIDPADTEDVDTAGTYKWEAWVTNIADNTITKLAVPPGYVQIFLGFDADATDAIETRSAAKIMLDAIDAALLAFATSDVTEYEISTPAGSRRVRRSDKVQLNTDRKYWAGIVTNEIARENARNGKPLMNSIKMVVKET